MTKMTIAKAQESNNLYAKSKDKGRGRTWMTFGHHMDEPFPHENPRMGKDIGCASMSNKTNKA